MNKIETDFEKIKYYEDIETYYPPLEDIKDFLYELFGDRVESQKYIVRANRKIEQLQSNWRFLREWLEKHDINTVHGHCILFPKEVLDKMNELESDDKNCN